MYSFFQNFDEIQEAPVQEAITTQANYDDANNANVVRINFEKNCIVHEKIDFK